MKQLMVSVWAEYLKVRKSSILWATFIVFAFIPLLIGLIMYIAGHPDLAAKLGIVGVKASLFGLSGFEGYTKMLLEAMAVMGLIGFGFVTTWVFGQEHINRTMKDILALPVSRPVIVAAKFLVISAWCMSLSVILFIVAYFFGKGIQGWSLEAWDSFSGSFFLTSFLTLFLATPVAWITGYSRGIIAPFGFIILTMILTQFVSFLGIGPWFPWAIPALSAIGKGSAEMQVGIISYMILSLTFIFGYFATLCWWRKSDHH